MAWLLVSLKEWKGKWVEVCHGELGGGGGGGGGERSGVGIVHTAQLGLI